MLSKKDEKQDKISYWYFHDELLNLTFYFFQRCSSNLKPAYNWEYTRIIKIWSYKLFRFAFVFVFILAQSLCIFFHDSWFLIVVRRFSFRALATTNAKNSNFAFATKSINNLLLLVSSKVMIQVKKPTTMGHSDISSRLNLRRVPLANC